MRAVGLFILIILFPTFVHAATLVNINTADAALLDTLPGIGTVIAGRIIDYRETNGPFTTIQDIQKVTGIGPGATYTKIASLITVGDANISDTSDAVSNSSASSTPLNLLELEEAAVYTPPPSALAVDAGSNNQDAVVGVPLFFSARTTNKGGAINSSAQIVWSFGDGSSASASAVRKTYYYAGTYLVAVTATDGLATGRDELMVTVRPARVRVLGIPDAGIMVTNDADERLDISNWTLFAGSGSFRIPGDTVILPKTSILLPSVVTHLVATPEVKLTYPDGAIATRSVPPTSPVTQPFVSSASSKEVQKVEPITSTQTNVQSHENAVSAPAATTEIAAAGAALSPLMEDSSSAPMKTSAVAPIFNLFKSPWILGFLGTMILAGGAFILL